MDALRTEPDGTEVVKTRAEAAELTMPPLLVLEPVAEFLDGIGLGGGELAWARIGDGQSNITYLMERGGRRFVLRRGPRPPIAKSTHDMVREARVQRGVARVGLPVPEILAVCEDESVLGVPFYVMDYLEGEIVLRETPAVFDTAEGRRAASEALVDTLTDLHGVDLEGAGLTEFGRPEGYLERQIATFSRLAPLVTKRDLPQVAEIARWLGDNVPTPQRAGLVHGDYRFGNVMFAPEAPPRISAVLDWEMATLGDPLADLGYMTVMYSERGSADSSGMDLSPATQAEGYFTKDELIERYAQRSGLDVSRLNWYQVLALWKASVFLEDMYTRWQAGERRGDEFAPKLKTRVPAILETASALTAQ